jgi:hypothetical protein
MAARTRNQIVVGTMLVVALGVFGAAVGVGHADEKSADSQTFFDGDDAEQDCQNELESQQDENDEKGLKCEEQVALVVNDDDEADPKLFGDKDECEDAIEDDENESCVEGFALVKDDEDRNEKDGKDGKDEKEKKELKFEKGENNNNLQGDDRDNERQDDSDRDRDKEKQEKDEHKSKDDRDNSKDDMDNSKDDMDGKMSMDEDN